MNKKSWIIFTAIIIGLFGLLIYRARSDKGSVADVDVFAIQQPSTENGEIGDHVLYPSDKAVTLIEYGDFQCPGCQSSKPLVMDMLEEYSGKVQYIFRNYPMSYHVNAKAASAATEAAGLQERYWDMFNMVFDNSDEWENASASARTDIFLKYAKELGLEVEQFKKDMDGESVKKKISFDTALGRKTNITGTPSFFLNGESIDTNKIRNKEDFREILNTAIEN